MKILISSDLAPPYIGGGETYTIKLSAGLVKEGHDVHWLTSRIPDTLPEEILDGVKIHRVPILSESHYIFPGRQSFSMTSLIKGIKLARQCDVVQINTLVPGISGWVIAKYAGKPSLLFCHEFFNKLWHKIGQNSFEKYMYPLIENLMCKAPYDWYVCPSEYSKTTIMANGISEDKITVIPHGIDENFFSRNNNDYKNSLNLGNSPMFGYFGRLHVKRTAQSKNLLALLKATELVVKQIPDAKLVLGGMGYEELQPYVKEMGLEKNVVYVGKLEYENIPTFLKACDVVVCPALTDGFCFLLGEAAACGVATVATNLGAHRERIDDGKTGLLDGDTPSDIAGKIIALLNDGVLRKSLGDAASEKFKDFTWEKSVNKHLEVYENVIQRKHI